MKCMGAQKQLLYLGVTSLLCVWSLSGCVGATRLPARSRGPAGETFQKKELDFAFLEENGTRREEVVRRLSAIDTAYSNPRLFWGRWSDSKWGYWWFVAAQGGGAGDAKRVWHVQNLLVSFDEDGVVQKKTVIGDEPALWRELHTQLASGPALDLSQPVTLYSGVREITLNAESIRITRRRGKNPTITEISPLKVARISHHGAPDKRSNVGVTCHTLYFAEKTAIGRRLFFCDNAGSVATMFQYLAQTGSKDLLWE